MFTKYLVRTGIPRYLGPKQNNNVFTKVTKYGRWELYSFETEIDAQACNESVTEVFVEQPMAEPGSAKHYIDFTALNWSAVHPSIRQIKKRKLHFTFTSEHYILLRDYSQRIFCLFVSVLNLKLKLKHNKVLTCK